MKIKKGDTVLVITGKDRNKTGKVIRTLSSENKIVVEGINIVKKHVKPTRGKPQGGIIDITKPIAISKALIICPSCSKAVRIGCKLSEKGKLRICRKCNASVDQELK
ncbi:MAG: 50S ribosomal protein L24 [bacterium]|nr:50S ribosomal protein L24 [bacterium]